MNIFRTGWYLIYTKPRHERKVQARLAEMQIDTFLPTRKLLRTWHDRKKYVDDPLFPSYVFIYLSEIRKFYEGIDTEGALYYVRTGREIARVSESVVNNLKLLTDKVKELEVSDSVFRPGQRMVINKGALTGLHCEIVQSEGKQKILVRVELIQRNVLVTLSPEHLMYI